MFWILFCTVLGFLVGLASVMVKRGIRPKQLLAATFLGVFAAAIAKIIKASTRKRRYY